ncbi:MAG: endonuclease III [Planctomycetes bacterium]|nr:endonuclease III [Planctomycetota bacterium]
MASKKTAAKKKIKVDKDQARQRVKKIWPLLKKTYPDAKIALNFSNPLELLVATILSAQCTDVRVNIVTKTLFKKYKTPADWADADITQIENDIKSTGFYRNKSKNIKAACRMIIADFQGKVPSTMDQLTKLAGVGRKTANVLLGNVFNTPGIACDTHVIRLSRRIGLSENSDPVKLELDLADIVNKKDWTMFSHLVIFHGRNICKARRPDCQNCPIAEYCPSANDPALW